MIGFIKELYGVHDAIYLRKNLSKFSIKTGLELTMDVTEPTELDIKLKNMLKEDGYLIERFIGARWIFHFDYQILTKIENRSTDEIFYRSSQETLMSKLGLKFRGLESSDILFVFVNNLSTTDELTDEPTDEPKKNKSISVIFLKTVSKNDRKNRIVVHGIAEYDIIIGNIDVEMDYVVEWYQK